MREPALRSHGLFTRAHLMAVRERTKVGSRGAVTLSSLSLSLSLLPILRLYCGAKRGTNSRGARKKAPLLSLSLSLSPNAALTCQVRVVVAFAVARLFCMPTGGEGLFLLLLPLSFLGRGGNKSIYAGRRTENASGMRSLINRSSLDFDGAAFPCVDVFFVSFLSRTASTTGVRSTLQKAETSTMLVGDGPEKSPQ